VVYRPLTVRCPSVRCPPASQIKLLHFTFFTGQISTSCPSFCTESSSQQPHSCHFGAGQCSALLRIHIRHPLTTCRRHHLGVEPLPVNVLGQWANPDVGWVLLGRRREGEERRCQGGRVSLSLSLSPPPLPQMKRNLLKHFSTTGCGGKMVEGEWLGQCSLLPCQLLGHMI
jgi:hypothetical protein